MDAAEERMLREVLVFLHTIDQGVERVQRLGSDYRAFAGDILLEFQRVNSSVATDTPTVTDFCLCGLVYALSAKRDYEEVRGSSTTRRTLPADRYFTVAQWSDGTKQLNSALRIDFFPSDSGFATTITDFYRGGCGPYLHNSLRLDASALETGRFARIVTPQQSCTRELVEKITNYARTRSKILVESW